jgi:tyrosine-protein kinase Etk/Wzc
MATVDHAEQELSRVTAQQTGFDLFDFLLVLTEARKTIAVSMLVCVVLGVLVCLFAQPTFTGSALILPPQQGQSLANMMGQLSALVSLAGAAGGSGNQLKTPADMYIGILQSRTISDHLISKFRLQQLYKARNMEDTRTQLKNNCRFLAGKDGLIHINVEDHDPNRASEMANTYVDELYSMNAHLAITEAAQRRSFFDQEMAEERSSLSAAEEDLKKTAEKTGVIHLGGQAESIIRSLASLRAQIASREVEINSLRTYATDENPVAIRARGEIDSLRQQLAKLENDPRNPEMADTVGIPAGRLPAVGLEYARKLREVKYHETLFELLAKQFEAARIDEAKAAPVIQVVDRAVPPDKKSGPHRLWIMVGALFIGFFVGYAVSIARRALHRAAQMPEYAIKLALLRDGFRLRRH